MAELSVPAGPSTPSPAGPPEDPPAMAVGGGKPRGFRAVLAFLRSSGYASAGFVIVAVYLLLAIIGPWLVPRSPTEVFPGQRSKPPSSEFWFGTDSNGMDVFSRTIAAIRVDMGLVVIAVSISLVLGIAIGLLTGYLGGMLDMLVTRVTDLIQSFPVLVFALAVVAALGHGVIGAVVVIATLDIPLYTRLIRSEVVRIRTSSYVTAAIAAGNSTARLLRVHVLPNAIPAILPQIAIRFAWAIGVVAALAFVGVGVQVPTPEWGSMIRIGSAGVISGHWWPSVFPGLAIAVLIIGFNMLADALQEHWNPRRRRDV